MIKVTSITVNQFSGITGLSRQRINILINEGRIEAYRDGKLWKITSLTIKPPNDYELKF